MHEDPAVAETDQRIGGKDEGPGHEVRRTGTKHAISSSRPKKKAARLVPRGLEMPAGPDQNVYLMLAR